MKDQHDDGENFSCPGCGEMRGYDEGDLDICGVRVCAECLSTELDAIANTVNHRYTYVCRERDELLNFFDQVMGAACDTERDTTLAAWAACQILRANLSVFERVSHPMQVALDAAHKAMARPRRGGA